VASAPDLNDLSAFQVSGNAGDFVFRQGDEGAHLFVLQHGRIELVDEASGSSGPLAVLEAGDVFGEGQLFAPGPRPVSARAVTEFQALRIDRATLGQMISEDVNVALGIIERLTRRHPAAAAVPAKPSHGADHPPATPPAPTGDPFLQLKDGETTFELTGKEEFVVGRVDRATGHVPDVDLSPWDEARSLSRHHARLLIRDGRVLVREEEGTRNGTFVDDRRLKSGVEVELAVGARVRFGLVDTVFGRRA